MLEILKRIRESTAYYKKQNKRLIEDDRLRKVFGKGEINQRHIKENEERIEKLREYYVQVAMQLKQQTDIKRTLK